MTPPRTSAGPRRLSELARKVVVPRDIESTAWPSVRDLCEKKLGLEFDEWQHGAGKLILAQRADGKLAAMIDGVGMSIPRQVGKTFLLAAIIFALCIRRPGLLVIWSAHHGKTHNETFLAMQAFAERPKVKPYIKVVYTGSGDEEVRFRNGSRILFGARERGFGRGIPGVDVLVFDEAQILSDRALANMLATMNVSQFGLSFFIGTPPRPEDDSEVFERLRAQAYAGELHDGAWIEFGADQGVDPKDRKAWAVANPSYPKRTPAESIMRLQRKLKPEDFLREGLGIWDEDDGPRIMPTWAGLGVSDLEAPAQLVVGLAGDVDGEWGSIGSAGLSDDGRLVVGAVDRRQGQGWLVAEAKRIQDEHGYVVALDEKGPLSDLVDDLKAEDVQFVGLSMTQYVDACQSLWRAVDERRLTHPKHPDLDAAVRRATWRKVSDRKAFGRQAGDISMLDAVTVAAWALNTAVLDEPAIY
jgi:hypothetical protein